MGRHKLFNMIFVQFIRIVDNRQHINCYTPAVRFTHTHPRAHTRSSYTNTNIHTRTRARIYYDVSFGI